MMMHETMASYDEPMQIAFTLDDDLWKSPSTQMCSVPSSSASLASILPQASFKKIRNVRKSDKHFCVVCGDRPTGYHYNVLSCNGCKTFFRRTVLANRVFKCTKGGNCQFDKAFRCSCRACRFAKCVKVGMDRTAIQYPTKPTNGKEDSEDSHSPDEEEHSSGEKTGQVMALRRSGSSSSNEGMGITLSIDTRQWNEQTMKIVEHLLFRENATHRMRQPNIPATFFRNSLREVLRQPCLIGLSNFEMADNKIDFNYTKDPFRFWMAADIYLQCEFAKSFEPFNRLSENDQLLLLSHVCAILQVATQSYYSYADKKADVLLFPDGLEALKEKMRRMKLEFNRELDVELYFRDLYNRPVHVLKELAITPEEFALFKAIALFSPNEMDISEEGRKLIEGQRVVLLHVLNKLCLANYGVQKGVEKMSSLLMLINLFMGLAERRRQHLLMADAMNTMEVTGMAKAVYLRMFDAKDALRTISIE